MYDRIVKDFLILRLKKGSTLLLGLSGGPDSMALLHFLMEAKKELNFFLHVAHVDHGWREESGREAETLRQMSKYHSLPFYLHRLEKMEGRDLENRSRNERLKFFCALHSEHHYQALLLAHHSGDHAETVFKRVAEGAGLRGLGGLYAERSIENLSVWRPLLSLKKKDLLTYLHRKKLHYFEDPTNQDPKYLRSRMRQTLFPTLEEIFGKRMEGNFARIGKMCQELADYFEEKGEEIEKKLVYGPFGAYLNLEQGIHSVELKYYLKELAPFSHDALEVLMKLIRERRCSRLIQSGNLTFQITRSHLFIYQNPFPDFFEKSELWTEGENGDWKEFWQGKIKIEEGVTLKKLSEVEPLLKRKLKKWFAAHHVPSFFYDKAPIFTKGNKVVGDSLTGKNLNILLKDK